MPFILAASAAGALPQIALTQSQTWVPPQDGNICIHVIGAGGAGRGKTDSSHSGGAGGYCKKNSLAVTTGGSFTVVVGVGGPRKKGNQASANGGNSTVAGTGLSATLTANGGASASSTASGAGGTAANGDVNNTGGAGHSTGGGGAVGVYGTGEAGQAILRGGQSDAAADGIGLSGFGYITGGNAGAYISLEMYDDGMVGPQDAGSLSGGGALNSTANSNFLAAGNGGIGGGGGGCRNSNNDGYALSGKGGDGLVLIQYLP